MSAYHATHASPYDEACSVCTGYSVTVEVDEPGPRWPVAWLVLGFGAVLLVAFASCGGFKA